MKLHFGTAAIAASLVTALGLASVAFSRPPPPPPPPYNPQITYTVLTQGGRTTTIYVSNADGTDQVPLYSTRNLMNFLKFAPTGNRIVFTEQNDIKILTYAVSTQGVTTTSVTTLTSEPYTPIHVDVSPDGTELLFVEHTADPNHWAVYVMSMSGGVPTQVLLDTNLFHSDAVWANSNSRIAVLEGAPVEAGFGTQTIQVVYLDPASNYSITNTATIFTSTVSGLYQIQRIESAHTSDTLVFDAAPTTSNFSVYTVDIGTMLVSQIVAGSNPSFSADDSTILFVGSTAPGLYEVNPKTGSQALVLNSGTRPDFLP